MRDEHQRELSFPKRETKGKPRGKSGIKCGGKPSDKVKAIPKHRSSPQMTKTDRLKVRAQ